eukprot:4388195-Pleurochrysis_carterae.AAC.1
MACNACTNVSKRVAPAEDVGNRQLVQTGDAAAELCELGPVADDELDGREGGYVGQPGTDGGGSDGGGPRSGATGGGSGGASVVLDAEESGLLKEVLTATLAPTVRRALEALETDVVLVAAGEDVAVAAMGADAVVAAVWALFGEVEADGELGRVESVVLRTAVSVALRKDEAPYLATVVSASSAVLETAEE